MILATLKQRFAEALVNVVGQAEGDSAALTSGRLAELAGMVRCTSDAKFGDYQANCAMPLAKLCGLPPRQAAQSLVAALDVADLCQPPEIAGPGFINLRLRDDCIAERGLAMLSDQRLGVVPADPPRRILIDYSSPNVAKPMHVGHIRSTVIGDALARIYRFLGHHVITDNHLGDWGTQFGMVIYGFKHFGDPQALDAAPVAELSRLYRLVNRLISYHQAVAGVRRAEAAVEQGWHAVAEGQTALADAVDGKQRKRMEKSLAAAQRRRQAAQQALQGLRDTIRQGEQDEDFQELAAKHPNIADEVLRETAKLHAGDPENLQLWRRFLPYCRDEIDRVYRRLGIGFDHTLGESFYHDMLGAVVQRLQRAGLASDSEGAVCVFLPEFDSPMIVQKKDGAYLYATTDLATLFYRQREFQPDEILYVVDSRQSEHFQKLFAVARQLGISEICLRHVQFGTVLGEDGRPFKTRSGSSVGLESLLDEAVATATAVVCDPQRLSRLDPPLDEEQQRAIADAVGHGAIKYADLAHHRTSDYRFDLSKMIALDGNTSAYVQYAYARACGIMRKGGVQRSQVQAETEAPLLAQPAERSLALQLLRFEESLHQVRADDAPNFLVDYLYDTAKAFAVFNDSCPVLQAPDSRLRRSRLVLVVWTARVIEQGLQLLGINVTPRM